MRKLSTKGTHRTPKVTSSAIEVAHWEMNTDPFLISDPIPSRPFRRPCQSSTTTNQPAHHSFEPTQPPDLPPRLAFCSPTPSRLHATAV